ncbi:MAG TPA: iron-sulfur cluster assembly accessory protein [Chitinophagales bacterium]|nr:iron-sulfur cluster assembly accessory protein [Chitinophagales bacterium]
MNDVLVEKETSVSKNPVTLTASAVKEMKRLLADDQVPADYGLRVGVKGGGCSGMTYVLGFDKKEETDQEFMIDGLRVFMNPSHQLYLFGMQVDFQQGLNARGFIFENPNATKTCGCGTSFSA